MERCASGADGDELNRVHPKLGPITKQLVVKFILPDASKRATHHIHAGKGEVFTFRHVQNLLSKEWEMVNRDLPQYEFEIVPLGFDHYNFIGKLREVKAV
jgi:hypothetical protein